MESNNIDNNSISSIDSDESTSTSSIVNPNSLDDTIDKAREQSKEMMSIINLIRGHQKPLKRQKTSDLKPIAYVRLNLRGAGKPKPITVRALLDSGGSGTLLCSKYAKKLKLKTSSTKTEWTTPGGKLKTTKHAKAQFCLPELHDNRLIEWTVHIAESLGSYDMIIGRDLLTDLAIDLKFSTQEVEWDEATIPFKDAGKELFQSYHIGDPTSLDDAADRVKHILDANYEAADLEEVCRNQLHLTTDEQQKLYRLMIKHESLFDGTLGTWTEMDYNIELKPDAKPYHARAFPIPRIHNATLRKEVDQLCELGVLKKVNRSEWAAPTFIIPKKDGTVRFISDFRELNKRIKRKPYPIPKIQDMLLNLDGFQHATSLDLNMGYYHIELNPDSKKLCTIVLPFGKYEYQRLPMGLCNSPDIFQEKMSDLMQGLEFVRIYLDDLLCLTSTTYEDHLHKLEQIFQRIQKAGLKVNANKSFFAKGELEYLGYWITRDGIQPLPKKVEAMLRIAEPRTRKELRSFIGLVNYYRDMWIRRSHLLAPLAELTSKKVQFKWKERHREAFTAIKRVIAREVLLAYPDFSKEFVIHTDASHTQLGAVISQDNRPIAFYSRKLKPEQTRYTTTERELLSIVETLKEFRNILLGHKIVVHTDHKNLTCKNFNTERVMRWRLILEEYGPELRYIKGGDNVVADALSRLDLLSDDKFNEQYKGQEEPTTEILREVFAGDDVEYQNPNNYPLAFKDIRRAQQEDQELLNRYFDNSSYSMKEFNTGDHKYQLIVREDKIVLPKAIQRSAAEWYHSLLAHPGETRTELTMGQHFYWKNMRQTIEDVCSKCHICQVTKPKQQKFGYLPPKENETTIPWHTLCIDLIGPYKWGNPLTKMKNGKIKEDPNYTELLCLTMIDPATGWFEITEIPDKKADTIQNKLEQAWFTRYPWPTQIVMDRGKEFMAEFIDFCKNEMGLTRKPITTRNPQANAMLERAHKTIHAMIDSMRILGKTQLEGGSWDGILSALRFGMNATVHTTLRATPAQLVFNRDALHNVAFQPDWEYIKHRKQHLIVQNNKKENNKRTPHQYKVDDLVLIKQDPNRKHGDKEKYSGPYTITHVNDNGTVMLKQRTNNGGAVYQTWNIRNIFPYKA